MSCKVVNISWVYIFSIWLLLILCLGKKNLDEEDYLENKEDAENEEEREENLSCKFCNTKL